MPKYLPIQVVDENDTPLGGGEMNDIHRKGLIHRGVHVIVQDDNGNYLLQKRGPNVAIYPNMWDYAAGGHVDEGESYLGAIIRELEEEAGIKGFTPTEIACFRSNITDGWRKLNRFVCLFGLTVPADIRLVPAAKEVTDLKWFTAGEIKALMRQEPAVINPELVKDLGKYYEDFRDQAAG